MTLAWTTRGSGAALCLAILILLALHAFVPPPPALAQTDEAAAEAAPAEAVAEDEGPELPEELLDPAVDTGADGGLFDLDLGLTQSGLGGGFLRRQQRIKALLGGIARRDGGGQRALGGGLADLKRFKIAAGHGA